VPIEKLKTGGTTPVLKREDACRIVPSPPSVITKSIGDEVASTELVSRFWVLRVKHLNHLKETMDLLQQVNLRLPHGATVHLDMSYGHGCVIIFSNARG
jgi:hypothetical protein